jgi:hypothetical protein
MRRVIYEVQPVQPENVKERPWWQTCSHVDFKERASSLDSLERLALLQEIKAALIATRRAVAEPRDEEHLRRARSAAILLSEKERILTAVMYANTESVPGKKQHAERLEIHRQDEKNRARNAEYKKFSDDCLVKARQSLEKGNLREALNHILIMVETKESGIVADKQKREERLQKMLSTQREQKITLREEQQRRRSQWKASCLQEARTCFDKEDLAGALSKILELLDGIHKSWTDGEIAAGGRTGALLSDVAVEVE